MTTPDRAALVKEARERYCAFTPERRCEKRVPGQLYRWCSSCLLAALVETEPADLRAYARHLPGCASEPCQGHFDGTVCTSEC